MFFVVVVFIDLTAARCQEGEVRLANGTTRFNGRVELCQNETWGTICQDGFEFNEAKVICRQLGFSVLSTPLKKIMYFLYLNKIFYIDPTVQTGPAFTYPLATGPIYLDNIDCTGTEPRVLSCQYDTHVADCTHMTDVGIDCMGYGKWTR